MNKTQDVGRATEGCSALQSLLSWCRARDGPNSLRSRSALPAPTLNGRGLFPSMAPTNKSLAQSNKSRTRGRATKKLRPLNGKGTPCKACKAICQRSSWSLSPRPHSWPDFAANAFARSWHVKRGRRGVGGEVKEGFPFLSPTQQSSFA